MTIDTDNIRKNTPYIISGAVIGLATALVIPAGIVLGAGALVGCAVAARRVYCKRKTDNDVVDIHS